MAILTSKKPSATYKSLLNIGTADNQELDGTLRIVEDGAGNDSSLKLTATGNTYGASFAGRVGVGTDAPAAELHISAGTPTIRLQDSDNTDDYINCYQSGGTSNFLSRNDTSNGSFNFIGYDSSDLTYFMAITNAGNVGIGTASPGHLLEVRGNADALSIGDDTNTAVYARFANSRTMIGYSGAYTLIQSGASKALRLQVSNDTFGSGTLGIGIDTLGNVGIGKTPSSRLDIKLSTEDLEIVDAGSTSATEQDWIEVEVGGNQGYIRVYATK